MQIRDSYIGGNHKQLRSACVLTSGQPSGLVDDVGHHVRRDIKRPRDDLSRGMHSQVRRLFRQRFGLIHRRPRDVFQPRS